MAWIKYTFELMPSRNNWCRRANLMLLGVLIVFPGCLTSCSNKTNCDVKNINHLGRVKMVDTKYMVTLNMNLLYSENKDGNFKFYIYKDGSVTALMHEGLNVFSPFIYKGVVAGIKDNDGDENYRFTDGDLDKLVEHKYIEKIYPSPSGNYIAVILKGSKELLFIDTRQNKVTRICNYASRVNTFVFSGSEDMAAISCDNKLLSFSISQNVIKEIANDKSSEKLNPYFYKNWVYFVNNDGSEYFQIYRTNWKSYNTVSELVFSSNHDLRMPKFDGKYLYYIEIINSEYLLKIKSQQGNTIQLVNNDGVVYNYDFWGIDSLLILYSNIYYPNCFLIYNKATKNSANITGEKIDLGIKSELIKKTNELSSAYIYKPGVESIKGVVLFIHPGLKMDFSPRWESILNSLANCGYIIVSPNYPMSLGYGKSYHNSGFGSAVTDICRWNHSIREKYKNIPLFYLSSSSGNILMEAALSEEYEGVCASASLFGLSYNKYIPKIPTISILGAHDPFVNMTSQIKYLESTNKNSIREIRIYHNEGHWFRSMENTKDCIIKLDKYFQKHSTLI